MNRTIQKQNKQRIRLRTALFPCSGTNAPILIIPYYTNESVIVKMMNFTLFTTDTSNTAASNTVNTLIIHILKRPQRRFPHSQ